MDIETIMSSSVVTVQMDDSLKIVKDIFDNAHFHHLLVIEAGKLVGVISDRDLLKAVSPKVGTSGETASDTATLNKKAHQIMARKLFVLKQHASLSDAIAIFNSQNISCIPIVDDEYKPVGIISWRDIIKTLK